MVETTTAKKTGKSEQDAKDDLTKARVSYLVRDWKTNAPDEHSAIDENEPGAYLRLGGYGDIEENTGKPKSFYPRKHVDDAGGDAAESVGGDEHKRGIVLACSGRMLAYAGERIYIHSGDSMDIDSEKDLRVNADGTTTITSENEVDINSRSSTISITSGPGQAINVTAGTGGDRGEYVQKSKKETRDVGGDSYELVTDNKYTLTHANTVAITMGGSASTTLGGKFAFFLGASGTINVAVSLSVSAVASISICSIWLGFNVLSATFNAFEFTKDAINAKDDGVEASLTKIRTRLDTITAKNAQIDAHNYLIGSQMATLKNTIATSNNM